MARKSGLVLSIFLPSIFLPIFPGCDPEEPKFEEVVQTVEQVAVLVLPRPANFVARHCAFL
jgi:hypothetical protein